MSDNTLEDLKKTLEEEDVRQTDLFNVIMLKEDVKTQARKVTQGQTDHKYSSILGNFADRYGVEYEAPAKGEFISYERFERELEDLTNKIITQRVFQ